MPSTFVSASAGFGVAVATRVGVAGIDVETTCSTGVSELQAASRNIAAISAEIRVAVRPILDGMSFFLFNISSGLKFQVSYA
jgi:hypothetical protein